MLPTSAFQVGRQHPKGGVLPTSKNLKARSAAKAGWQYSRTAISKEGKAKEEKLAKRTKRTKRKKAPINGHGDGPCVFDHGGVISVRLPLRTVSEANVKEHWAVRRKRTNLQRAMVSTAISMSTADEDMERITSSSPIMVKITRIGKRRLDCDNLARSNKAIRDGIADALGIDDGDERIRWHYGQRTSNEGYWVEIKVC